MAEDRSGFGDLDYESLVAICSRLDGKSIANFQLLNSYARRAALADAPWLAAFQREFPEHYRLIQRHPPLPSWRSAYAARQRAERCWATGGPSGPAAMVKHDGKPTFGITFLDDPLPRNLVLSGSRVEATQSGELDLLDLNEIGTVGGPQGHVVPLRVTSALQLDITPICTGIFHLAQRPGTNEVAITTFGPDVHVVRLFRNDSDSHSANGALDSSDDQKQLLDAPSNGLNTHISLGDENLEEHSDICSGPGITSEAAQWEFSPAYNLGGHGGGCSTVRAHAETAATACFDGSVRIFRLPNTDAADIDTCSNAMNSNHTNSNHTIPELTPILTLTDDPEHSMVPVTQDNRGVCGLDISADATRVITGSNDMQIKVWDTATGKITLRLTGSQGWPWWLEGVDSELQEIVTASTDGRVALWDVQGGLQSAVLDLGQRYSNTVFPVAAVAPRVDGNYLAAGCFGHKVHVIDRRMMRVLSCLEGHTDRLSRLALREDTLLSAAFDGTVGVWNFT